MDEIKRMFLSQPAPANPAADLSAVVLQAERVALGANKFLYSHPVLEVRLRERLGKFGSPLA